MLRISSSSFAWFCQEYISPWQQLYFFDGISDFSVKIHRRDPGLERGVHFPYVSKSFCFRSEQEFTFFQGFPCLEPRGWQLCARPCTSCWMWPESLHYNGIIYIHPYISSFVWLRFVAFTVIWNKSYQTVFDNHCGLTLIQIHYNIRISHTQYHIISYHIISCLTWPASLLPPRARSQQRKFCKIIPNMVMVWWNTCLKMKTKYSNIRQRTWSHVGWWTRHSCPDYLRLVHEMKTVSTSSLDPTFEQVEMNQPKVGVLGS